MTKVLYCKDIGFDCGFVAKAESEAALLEQAAKHAEEVHGVHELPPEVVERVRAAIREE